MSFIHWCNVSVLDTPHWTCLPTYENRDCWSEQQHTLLFLRRKQALKNGKSLPIMSELQDISKQGSSCAQSKGRSISATSDETVPSMTRPSVIMHTSKIQEEKVRGNELGEKSHFPPLRLKLSWSKDEMTSSDELDDEEDDRDEEVSKYKQESPDTSYQICQRLYGSHEMESLQHKKSNFRNVGAQEFAYPLSQEVASTFHIPQYNTEMVGDSDMDIEKTKVLYESVIKRKDLHHPGSSIKGHIGSEIKTGIVDDITSTTMHSQLNEQEEEVLYERLQYYLSYFRRHSINNIEECMQILNRNLLTLFPVSTIQSETGKAIRAKIFDILQKHQNNACNMKNESKCTCAHLLKAKVPQVTDFSHFEFSRPEKSGASSDYVQESCYEEGYSVCTQSKSTCQQKVSNTSKAVPFTKTYTCEFCIKTFKHEPSYEKHLLTHKGKRTFRCLHCSRSFYHGSSYQRHLKSHTGEKPHQCNYCNMAFCKKSALKVHLRTHTGHQPYSCTYCSKSFSISGNLQRHLHIHTGQRPYKCGKCPKTFNNPSHLARHITSAHVD